jgi:CRISPR-associated protein Csm1
MPNASHYAALKVIQDEISILASWVNVAFPPLGYERPFADVQPFINTAKEILNWSDQTPTVLQLVFDQIRLSDQPLENSTNYRPAWALEVKDLLHQIPISFWTLLPIDWLASILLLSEKTPRIPYTQPPEQAKAGFEDLQSKIRHGITQLDPENLAQLTLFLEKFGSHLGIKEKGIALIDQARSTAALAAALAQNPLDNQLALIAGDLMGVQKFIYTIASDGALKSLRARSFFLEIATEEIVYRLLQVLELPRTNIIYAGASKFYILASWTDRTCDAVQKLQNEFNDWLLRSFQKKVFLAMAVGDPFPAEDLSPDAPLEKDTTRFAKHWQAVNGKLAAQASRKFSRNLTDILQQQDSHEPCKVCRRDDTTDLDNLNKDDPSSIEACPICRQMFALGGKLLRAKALLRTTQSQSPNIPEYQRQFEFQINNAFYQVFDTIPKLAGLDDVLLLINNWQLKDYTNNHIFPLILSNYGQESKEEQGFMSAREFANESKGIQRVGYLRMDVDRLSQIFSKGLGQLHTLPRVAGLSRQMSYFFKVYLKSLADDRQRNFLDHQPSLGFQVLPQPNPEKLARKNLLFIYAGGDDLFISGAWDEVVNFAFDVYQSFRAYIGNHPDITLSAGITIADDKFPLYQAAEQAGKLEDKAKDNDRDSLAMFGEVLHWSEWFGTSTEQELTGVFPFVERLLGENLELNTARAFVRNLLITAQQQDQLVQERQQRINQLQLTQSPSDEALIKRLREIDRLKREQKHIRTHLHLPKLAYTLQRLPKTVRDRQDFLPVRTSLKQIHNAPYFRAIATWIELLTRNT